MYKFLFMINSVNVFNIIYDQFFLNIKNFIEVKIKKNPYSNCLFVNNFKN